LLACRRCARVIRKAVEDCAPFGSVPGGDYLTPEFTAQAEALLRGIYAMAGRYTAAQLNSGRDIVGRQSSAKYHQYRAESGKAEAEPGIEQPVVGSRQRFTCPVCRSGEVTHADLYPDHREPAHANKNVKQDREQIQPACKE
jgi:RNA polymerase subunit RPABC4/transcription elongation factor Spt4